MPVVQWTKCKTNTNYQLTVHSVKLNEIKHPASGINDITSYASSCHASSTSCDSDECVVPCPQLLDCCLLCLIQQSMNSDMDSPEVHPERPLCHQFWTSTRASCHLCYDHCISHPCPFWTWSWTLHCGVTSTAFCPVNQASHMHQRYYDTSKSASSSAVLMS